MEDGQYLPLPPQSGWLEIIVYRGLFATDANPRKGEDSAPFGRNTWDILGYYPLVRWQMFQPPKVEIVEYKALPQPPTQSDIEHRAVLHPHAAESLDIDTLCGTLPKANPSARGVFYTGKAPLKELWRAGRTASPEVLLIGTLYSQFAARRTTLSGVAEIRAGLAPYTEACQGDKRFLLTADVQDLIEDNTEAKYVELRPDEYAPKN